MTDDPKYTMHIVWNYGSNSQPLCGKKVPHGEEWCVFRVLKNYVDSYRICPECLASEDYPMLALANAGEPFDAEEDGREIPYPWRREETW
jgi:hypothetical protein